MEGSQVLVVPEAEAYVESIEAIDVKDVGSIKWQQQHERLESLNMQAILSASQEQDEFIKEFLVMYDKIPMLIRELLATEAWKQFVFPELISMELDHGVMFPMYMVLYHEATIVNLLETTMYHAESTETAGEEAMDLLDYCYRKVMTLLGRMARIEAGEEDADDITDGSMESSGMTTLEELEKADLKLNFDIGIKAVSLLRYIIDHMKLLPINVTHRLLNIHDIPELLVQLINNPPWTRTKEGKLQKYLENKWEDVEEEDRYKLSKTEGQVWLSLYQLLLSEDCQNKYELNQHRKNMILTLRNQLQEIILDQLPVLSDLRRYLEQLSMMDPPPVKKDIVIESLPEIRADILKTYDGKWEKIAKKQSKTVFNPQKMDMKAQAKRLANTYNMEMMESILCEPPKCALCGAEASKRCSRCQNEWYCRRECQVNHWKKHKVACDLMVESLEKIKQQGEAATKA